MNQFIKQTHFFFSPIQTNRTQLQLLAKEGFSESHGIHLFNGHEKKSGTLKENTSYLLYFLSLSPPIRPMVENNSFSLVQVKKKQVQNLIEEAA